MCLVFNSPRTPFPALMAGLLGRSMTQCVTWQAACADFVTSLRRLGKQAPRRRKPLRLEVALACDARLYGSRHSHRLKPAETCHLVFHELTMRKNRHPCARSSLFAVSPCFRIPLSRHYLLRQILRHHLASRCTKNLRIDPRRLMSKLLHVLNVRPRIDSEKIRENTVENTGTDGTDPNCFWRQRRTSAPQGAVLLRLYRRE